jgi:hypothetical protein
MTTIQAVFFGIMLALTPSIVLLAFLLWREGVGIAEDEEARSRDLYSRGIDGPQAPTVLLFGRM